MSPPIVAKKTFPVSVYSTFIALRSTYRTLANYRAWQKYFLTLNSRNSACVKLYSLCQIRPIFHPGVLLLDYSLHFADWATVSIALHHPKSLIRTRVLNKSRGCRRLTGVKTGFCHLILTGNLDLLNTYTNAGQLSEKHWIPLISWRVEILIQTSVHLFFQKI